MTGRGVRTAFRRVVISLLLYITPATFVYADTALLSERTYKRLSVVHELMSEGKYAAAQERLDALAPTVSSRNYENAVVQQTYGYLYIARDQPRKAITAFEACLASQAMPESAQQGVRLNLAQVYMNIGEPRKALSVYETWISGEKSPSPAGHALGGTLYAQAKQYARAAGYLDKAIRATAQPPEDWYRLLVAVYYEDNKFKQAAQILEKMVARFPGKKDYWQQLSAAYSRAGDDRRALAALQLAHEYGLLGEEKEWLNLARYYLYLDIPQRAMQLLEQGMQEKVIAASAANLELLSQACLRAGELQQAVTALARVADFTGDAKYRLQMAHLQAETGAWKQVNASINAALQQGNLEKPGEAYLLQGISYFELNEHEKARDSFERAQQHAQSAHAAQQWLVFMANRLAMSP